jgi:hypothetical protein
MNRPMRKPKGYELTKLLYVLALVAAAHPAWALNADEVRGGWEATINGTQHVYEFTIRGDTVRGAYCAPCSDGQTLAYVHGTLGADAMRLLVDHVRADGSVAYQDHVTARIQGDHLLVSGQKGGRAGGAFSWKMRKDQRGPVPFGGVAVGEALPQPGAPAANVAAYGKNGQWPPPGGLAAAVGAGGAPWEQPGPWEQLTPARLQGLWLTGSGPGKQNFFIRRDGDQLFGLVCGPCDNPYTMVALVDFVIRGDTVTFNLCHEDNGLGPLPFYNHITARLTRNELRVLSVVPDNHPPQARPAVGFTLLGPIPLRPG